VKADLHVHTYHSGYAKHFSWLKARESYSDPFVAYQTAKSRGMDLVCFTDHDTLDGCLEFLDAHPSAPDFIVGEEIECRFPGVPGLRVHLGAIGMTERIHRDLQPLRNNVFETAAYLREQQVFVTVNHLFFLFNDEMAVETYVAALLSCAPGIETRNGAMIASHNGLIADLVAARRQAGIMLTPVGGSDAHTLRRIGTTYTETRAATREDFLADLWAGHASVGGRHGGAWPLVAEIYGAIFNYWRSLAGLERHALTSPQRLIRGAASLSLLPMQFLPALIAWRLETEQARRIGRYRAAGLVSSPALGGSTARTLPA
jgi:predicted metal-dependent phosphoesterase TrpH